jgi:hypothetical protein
VPDVETFVHITTGSFATANIKDLPAGPSIEERAQTAIMLTSKSPATMER